MTVNILNTARALFLGAMALLILSACGLEEDQKWERVEYQADALTDDRTAGRHYKYVLVDMADEKGPVLAPMLEETKEFVSDLFLDFSDLDEVDIEEGETSSSTIIITKENEPKWKSPLVPRETTMLPKISKRILLEPMMPPFIRERAMPIVKSQDDMMIQRATPIFNEDQKIEYVSQPPAEEASDEPSEESVKKIAAEMVEEAKEPKVIKKSIYEDAEFIFEKRMVK